MRYDRARRSLDRHATYIVAAYLYCRRQPRRRRPVEAYRPEMLRLTVMAARRSCLSLPFCGDAPRPRREREPPNWVVEPTRESVLSLAQSKAICIRVSSSDTRAGRDW